MPRLRTVATLILVAFATASFTIQEQNKEDWKKIGDPILTEIKDFRNWPIAPGTTEKMEGSRKPHEGYVTIRANEIAMKAVEEGAQFFPEGSIITKDNFSQSDKSFRRTDVMKKVGRWWVYVIGDKDLNTRWAADSTDLKINSCLRCHAGAVDQVFFWKTPEIWKNRVAAKQ